MRVRFPLVAPPPLLFQMNAKEREKAPPCDKKCRYAAYCRHHKDYRPPQPEPPKEKAK